MSNAFLVGKNDYQNGRREVLYILIKNPSLYSTVISNHATSISHPTFQPQHIPTTPMAISSMAVVSQAIPDHKMSPGEYAIPVRIDGGSMKGPATNGYETPSFIHKRESPLSVEHVSNTSTDMKSSMQKDIQTFIAQFDNAHDKKERVDICILNLTLVINGKKRLAEDAQTLTKDIELELKELLYAKE